MKKISVFLFLFLISYLSNSVYAIESPFSTPNNKIGVHILFPDELEKAASLVNGNGGDWGYVTIPIQAGDRDLTKWQSFMDNALKYHVIPLLRLATEGDYFNTKVWRKPTEDDIVDFANFLNSLQWPVKNRYIIVFNEPNRNDEWGGNASPPEYASILQFAYEAFKQRSQDFFIISAGLDNAASSDGYNEFTFLKTMDDAIPGVFEKLDGIGSHSYPNPGFSSPPSFAREGVDTFAYEQNLIQSYTGTLLPVFITETGWSQDVVSDSAISQYYSSSFASIWNSPYVISVTPFLLRANSGDFIKFSFLKNEQPTSQFLTLQSMKKVKGQPVLTERVIEAPQVQNKIATKSFKDNEKNFSPIVVPQGFKVFIKWLLKL